MARELIILFNEVIAIVELTDCLRQDFFRWIELSDVEEFNLPLRLPITQ